MYGSRGAARPDLTAVRELDSSSANQIMDRVQSQASLSEAKMHVDDLLERGALAKSEKLIEIYNEVQRLQEFGEKAQRREDVMENNGFVSHLLSLVHQVASVLELD
ncbi:hypothetical protein N7474_003198 [Penicillium riverlandense]|uniref:uncharacterized protein n=1 Tax=Penicillium riverlandense TaxID=1903569 RepID=UPI0025480A63|nr:uncharacterized protein N7474_003198 [Penicillium riverlandense]KAJ5826060.1 hypothetical protein N7474_003198 [Penicillium riverlandense]